MTVYLTTTDIHLIMNPSIQNGKRFIVNFKLKDNELPSILVVQKPNTYKVKRFFVDI